MEVQNAYLKVFVRQVIKTDFKIVCLEPKGHDLYFFIFFKVVRNSGSFKTWGQIPVDPPLEG